MDKLKQRVYDVVSCKKNMGVLRNKIQVLKEDLAQVQPFVMSGDDEVQSWFAEADGILQEASDFLEGGRNSCCDPTFGWETGDMLRGIDKILEKRNLFDLSSYFVGRLYCNKLQSREDKLQEILKLLIGADINVIGIYGMIGVGKTILAEELARRARDNHLFDSIVAVEVPEPLDAKLVQTQIADQIGLQLSEADDEETRAHILYTKLQEKIIDDTHPMQQSKILVILDGLQQVISLREVGIPCGQEGRVCFKVVLISRSANICKAMGAEKEFVVGCLSLNEAKILFRERLVDKIGSVENTLERYSYMENAFLIKCRGLPLVIDSLACKLRSKSWSDWERIVDRLERHTLGEVDELHEVTQVILELCNRFIQNGRNHKMFLLCCLVLKGTDLNLVKLMRYAIGLALFEEQSLASLLEKINSWIDELKYLSLLMERTEPNHFVVHDIVQDVAITALSKGENVLDVLLDAGAFWQTKQSYENCIAISMMPESNYNLFNGLELHKLESFSLKGKPTFNLSHQFFQGMQNLKVLDISGITYVDFPSSIGDLKNLVTLHLEYCSMKSGFVSTISSLAKLEVLSLRESRVETLTEEIGKLTSLRVLDLTCCKDVRTFCIDALAKLDQLRELYLYEINWNWATDDIKKLISLPLKVLEIVIPTACEISLSFPDLDSFKICIGSCYDIPPNDFSSFSRVLLINGDNDLQLKESSLRDLLSVTEFLLIDRVRGLSNGLGTLNSFGFRHLKELHLLMCGGMKCVLDTSKLSMIERDLFPVLEILTITISYDLTSICHWLPRESFLPNLRELRLKELIQLHPYVLPVHLAAKLTVMEVSNCWSLLSLFRPSWMDDTDGTDSSVEFSYMRTLELKGLISLLALQDLLEASTTKDELGRTQILLFNEKIKFPSLIQMHLEGLDQISYLWDSSEECDLERKHIQINEPYGRSTSFGNLKYMTISKCKELKTLFPSSVVASFLQLENLQVSDCCKMTEIITSKLEDSANPTTMIVFPKLQTLRLKSLVQLQCFYRAGRVSLKLPMLRNLDLCGLREMKAFILSDAQPVQAKSVLFTDEIKLPSLEEMCLKYLDQIEKLWDFSGSKECDFANLKYITVSFCNKLDSMFPTQMVNSLSQLGKLEVESCSSMKEVITSEVEDDANLPITILAFGKLQLLKLWSLTRLQCFYRGDLVLKFPILRELDLSRLWELKSFALRDTLPAQTEGTILFDGQIDFPSLERLGVSCMDIELLQRHDVSTIFANLSRLALRQLPKLKSLPEISSKALRFLDLQKIECCRVLFSVQSKSILPLSIMSSNLEELRLTEFESLEELIDDEYSVGQCFEFFSLRKLELLCFVKLKKIPWRMLQNIHSLIIYRVKGLTSLISTSLLARGDVLPFLESIEVVHCVSLEVVVSHDKGQGEGHDFTKYGMTLFPCLRNIQLYWLPKLGSFNAGGYEAHFPSLETVELWKCQSLKSFSTGPFIAPKLKYVKLDSKIMEANRFDDLGAAVAAAAGEAEAKRMADSGKMRVTKEMIDAIAKLGGNLDILEAGLKQFRKQKGELGDGKF